MTQRLNWLPRWVHRTEHSDPSDGSDNKAPWVVVFIDVAASVALYRQLGDVLAASRIATALEVVRRHAAVRGGEFIKRSGDELLLLFSDPGDAADALIEIQNDARLDLRIGAHRGVILRQGGDVYGDTVNLAARLTAIARARQVVLSRPLFESLNGTQRSLCERFQRLRIKGVATSVPIYQLRWEGGAATAINTLEATQYPRPSTLVMELVLDGPGHETAEHSGEERRAGLLPDGDGDGDGDGIEREVRTTLRISGGEDALIGRDPSCDLIIDHPRVSRFHATVESHDGQFLLRDHSTNGSVLQANPERAGISAQPPRGQSHGSGGQAGARPLRRATVPLRGRGAVSFGHTDPSCAGIPRVTFLVA